MPIFQDVTLGWKGKNFVVKSNDVMRLIAKVEKEITLGQLTQESGPPLAALAMGYCVALSHAGHSVEWDDVYAALFQGEGANVSAAVTGLMLLMMPPENYNPPAKKPAAKTRKTKKRAP